MKLKRISKATLYTICSLCLAFSGFMTYTGGRSFILFGEPEYPTEEK